MIVGSVTVKKLTLHLPVAEVEPPLRPTAQALPVRAPPARKRTAELRMPATKHSRYKMANFSRQRLHDVLPLEISRNVLHPLTRKEIGNWAR